MRKFLFTVFVALFAFNSFGNWTIGLPNEDGVPSLAPLLESRVAAVVNISIARQNNSSYRDPFFDQFFGQRGQRDATQSPTRFSGSGVIIDAEKGYVITNHHVIANAAEVIVTLKDLRNFKATLIGSDSRTDLALLQIEAADLTGLVLADSDGLRVGDFVIAIGNPFGLGQTVTTGVVSALGRNQINRENYENFIQTDA